MPKDTRRRRTKCVFNVLITLAAFIITAAVIILYVRFGLTITDSSNSTESIHNVVHVKISATPDSGMVSVSTVFPTIVTVGAIKSAQDERFQKAISNDSQPKSTTTEERQLKRHYSTTELLLSSRSLNKGVAQGEHFAVGPSLSRNTLISLDIGGGNLTDDGSHTTNQQIGNSTAFDVDNDENDPGGINDKTGLHQSSNRQVKHKQINRNDYALTDRSATEEDSSAGYHNPYHLSYNVGEYGYKNDDHPADETVWPTIVKSEPTIPESSWPEVVGASGGWDRPAYGGVPVDYGHDYKPLLVRPPKIPIKNHLKVTQHKTSTIDWHKIGMLALIKLGMVKLKAIGFFKILFLLVFKLKLYMIAVFFKFLLIVKLLKFFKILLMPLFIVRLLPTLFQLLSASMQLADTLRRPAGSGGATTAGSASQSGQSGGLLPSRPGVSRPGGGGGGTSGTDVVGGATGTSGGSSSSMSAGSSGGAFLPGTAGGNRVPGVTGFASFKLDDSDSFGGRPIDTLLESRHDPALDVFQQVLDTEKCVERIACRIAAAENTGIMPFWINWMLFRISSFIPNDKLESYLKTYKDVNDEIRIRSSTPDSWATWCSERYECNNNNSDVSKSTDTIK